MTLPTKTVEMDAFYAAAWQARRPGNVDNIFGQTAGWNLLVKQNKASRTQRGGRFIEQTLRYAKNETVRFIGRGAQMPMTDTQNLTVAYFNWKYMAGSIVRYFTDEQQTTGKTKIIDLAKDKINTLEMSLIEYADAALWGDGTGDGGLAIDGLPKLIEVTPSTSTTSNGGFTGAVYPWWRNQYAAASGDFDIYGISDLRNMRNDCSNGGQDFPKIYLTTQAVLEAYEDEGLEYYMFSDRANVDLGLTDALKFKGGVLVWCTNCTANTIYLINPKYLDVTYDPAYNFEMTEWKNIPDQPFDRAAQVVWVGNLTVSNRARQGRQVVSIS